MTKTLDVEVFRVPGPEKFITAYAWSPSRQTCQVQIKANGVRRVYEYSPVDEATWRAFCDSESKGTYYNQTLKPGRECKALGAGDEVWL